jgi:hypothetical protein
MPPKKNATPKNTQESCDADGKDLNVKTGRCVKKCGPLQIRYPETGKCAKPGRAPVPRAKTAKRTRAPKNTQESCDADGKDLNVKTGRCVKKCGPLQIRNRETGKCAKASGPSTKKARKTKPRSPEPASLSFDNYEPAGLASQTRKNKSRSPQPYEENFSRKPKTPLLLGYNYPLIKPKIKPPSPIKKSLREQITTEEIDETKKAMENRIENIQKELRAKINKGLNSNEAEQLQNQVENITDQIKELDDLMARNVANGYIVEKQDNVADEIDKLENKVENKSPSPQPFKSKHRSAYSRKSRPPQLYSKAKDQLLLGYEPSNKQLVEQYGLKKHSKIARDKGNSPEVSPSSTPESPSITMMDFFTGKWK